MSEKMEIAGLLAELKAAAFNDAMPYGILLAEIRVILTKWENLQELT